MRSKPRPSERVREARAARNRVHLRWGIAGVLGVAAAFSGLLVVYFIQEMEHPTHTRGVDPEGFRVWWFEFAGRWRWALGSATSGTLWVLLPALSYPEKRKLVATRMFGTGVMVIFMNGVAFAWSEDLPVWEITVPAFLCSLLVNFLLGMEVPPVPEDPLKRKAKPIAIPPSPPKRTPPLGTWTLRYEATLEQLVDDDMALHFGPGVIGTDIFLRSCFVLFLFLLVYLLLPEDMPYRLAVLGVLAAGWILPRSLSRKRRIRDSFRKAHLALFEDGFPVEESWECDGEHLTFRRVDGVIALPLTLLSKLEDRPEGIHLAFRSGQIGLLPDRAFADGQDRLRWHERLASFLPQEVPQEPEDSP